MQSESFRKCKQYEAATPSYLTKDFAGFQEFRITLFSFLCLGAQFFSDQNRCSPAGFYPSARHAETRSFALPSQGSRHPLVGLWPFKNTPVIWTPWALTAFVYKSCRVAVIILLQLLFCRIFSKTRSYSLAFINRKKSSWRFSLLILIYYWLSFICGQIGKSN